MDNKQLWEKFENHLLNDGVTKIRIEKLKSMFKVVERGLNKDFEKITRDDLEKLVTAMHRNRFRKVDGKEFSGSTKSDIKKFLKQFFKWYKGDNEAYPKEVSWIRSRISKDELPKEKSVISMGDAVSLANSFHKIETRILVLVLFDGGFRIQEMLSMTKKDVTWEEYDETQKCFWIQCNQSKTERRKIPIPLFTEDVKDFFNSSYFKNLKDTDLVFPISYAYFLRKLEENSKSLLKLKISPHCLRHSSATHYAREFDGNMVMLAERYGWTYSSKELRTYIRRSGAYQKAGAKKVFTNEVMRVKEENNELRKEVDRIKSYLKEIANDKALLKELVNHEGN